MKVNVTELDTADEAVLYCRYEGQSGPQPVVVSLDMRDGELSIDYDGTVGSGTRRAVYDGDIREYFLDVSHEAAAAHFSVPTATAANALLREIAPLAQRVLDACAAEERIRDISVAFTLAEDALQSGLYWSGDLGCVCDWAGVLDIADVVSDYDITADTTTKELVNIEQEIMRQLQGESPVINGFAIYSGDLLAELTEERDSLRAAVTVDQG